MGDPSGPARERAEGEPIEQLVIHPILDKAYVSSEHPEGQLEWLGDALGTDFIVMAWHEGWARLHKGDGKRNEDWFGFGANVLAPISGTVVSVTHPVAVNAPGVRGHGSTEKNPGGGLIISREDGVHVAMGHVMNIEVEEGEQVVAGQVIARLGNNGVSWAPHVHVGAWRGDTPLQLCVDLAAVGRMLAEQGEAVYYGLPAEMATGRTGGSD